MRSTRDRLEPELAEALKAFIAATGPRGLAGVIDIGPRRAKFMELMEGAEPYAGPPVESEDRLVAGPNGGPDVKIRIYRPAGVEGQLPLIYYIHGGGMCIGSIETEDATTRNLCAAAECVGISVEYRLAPENPHPAPVEDCYAGLAWAAKNASEIGIKADRIAIYGGSAGGCLAAATALLAREREGPALAYQMLIYPMLDDRADSASCKEIEDLGVWDGWANLEGWQALLGDRQGTSDVDSAAAPARCSDLANLPPAWIEVGQLDALRDEDILYASRLMQSGVDTNLRVHPGAFHGWDLFAPAADLTKRAVSDRISALKRALH